MSYALARPLLFALAPESAHAVTLRAADLFHATGLLRALAPGVPALPVEAFGLRFPNPVGLAAGLDKDAAHIDALAALGFGFIEVGTVTPQPQAGNPRPRLFRLPAAEALVNRFGFNNVGLDVFLDNVKRARWRGVLGINIGKNADTPMERAADDYLSGLERVYAAAGYITVNVSSPNTQGLRALQDTAALDTLLGRLAGARTKLADQHGRRVPLLLGVAVDRVLLVAHAEQGRLENVDVNQVQSIADAVRRHGFDGIIATNTSVSREGVEGLAHADEAGGLSGAPIRTRATRALAALHAALGGEIPLVGVGGILQGAHAVEKTAAGATLVQLYTGLIYRGPALVGDCVRALSAART